MLSILKYLQKVLLSLILWLSYLQSQTSALADAYAQSERTQCRTRALIGYGGTRFGLANSCTNGHTINVDIAMNYLPKVGKGLGPWLVDDYYEGSGYALRMDKILESGTLGFHEIMTSAKTYTDIVITQKPANNLSPLASWSNAVAQIWLIPVRSVIP